MKKLKFYEFSQNNSGGSFVVDENLCHRLFIEADTKNIAKEKMLDLGAYFDGEGDCECCGNRWSEYAYEQIYPYRYGTFNKVEANKIAKKYKARISKTTFRFMNRGKPNPESYDVIFPNPIVHAKYLKDN